MQYKDFEYDFVQRTLDNLKWIDEKSRESTIGTFYEFTNLVNQFGPYAFVGIAGFFAKFTQRTLNNKRFPNAALNIITASVLGTVVSFVWVLIGSVSSDDATLTFTDALKREGLSLHSIAGSAILIFLLLAKVLPQVFIPRDTPFLSRKEKSKLLND